MCYSTRLSTDITDIDSVRALPCQVSRQSEGSCPCWPPSSRRRELWQNRVERESSLCPQKSSEELIKILSQNKGRYSKAETNDQFVTWKRDVATFRFAGFGFPRRQNHQVLGGDLHNSLQLCSFFLLTRARGARWGAADLFGLLSFLVSPLLGVFTSRVLKSLSGTRSRSFRFHSSRHRSFASQLAGPRPRVGWLVLRFLKGTEFAVLESSRHHGFVEFNLRFFFLSSLSFKSLFFAVRGRRHIGFAQNSWTERGRRHGKISLGSNSPTWRSVSIRS